MNVLFVHLFAPSQFEHIAKHLVKEKGHRCTLVCESAVGTTGGIKRLRYRMEGRPARQSHYCSRPFEETVRRAAGVYEALKPLRDRLRPDLILGHSGFGSTLFLPELFPGTPIINYFEYYCHPHQSALDFRPEWAPSEHDLLRARARNATMLLDLENCSVGYTPTYFQKGLFPQAYQPKIRVIHDGIDTSFWRRQSVPYRRLGGLKFARETRLVTYVSRGLESTRGFDIFLKVAKRIYEADPRVVFLVVGGEQIHYGSDLQYIREKSFYRHAWNQGEYDLRRFRFLGQVSRRALAKIFSVSDLHIYLTIPFVLSWSLLNAMACECTVLGSDTEPVREVIRDNQNGLLRDFFDEEGLARRALQVLKDPAAYRVMGRAARKSVLEKYSLPVIMPRLASFYEAVSRRDERH
jgi:glycosyltransferase involved in cell wall biosynthesis